MYSHTRLYHIAVLWFTQRLHCGRLHEDGERAKPSLVASVAQVGGGNTRHHLSLASVSDRDTANTASALRGRLGKTHTTVSETETLVTSAQVARRCCFSLHFLSCRAACACPTVKVVTTGLSHTTPSDATSELSPLPSAPLYP